MDGQQRLAAAKGRDEITHIPCLVWYDIETVAEEASLYIDIAKNRKMITTVETHRAMVAKNDPVALKLQKLAESSNRILASHSHAHTKRGIICVGAVRKWIEDAEEIVYKVYPIVDQICDDRILHSRIFEGMCYLEQHLISGSLSDRRAADRLLKVGHDALLGAINNAMVAFVAGGAKVWAIGILQALNKGLHNKYSMDTVME
jgi:hypothetical protein